MRAVGIKTQERKLVVDHVLGQNPGYQRLSHPAFFAADKMNGRHVMNLFACDNSQELRVGLQA